MNEHGHSPVAMGSPDSLSRPGTNDSRADHAIAESEPQLQHRLFHMAAQLEVMQTQLDQLVAIAQSGDSQMDTLMRHFTNPDASRTVEERLADLVTRMEAQQEQLDEMLDTTKKLSRTQFKSNTLAESKEQQIASALAALQEIVSQRERRQEAGQEEIQERQRLVHGRIRGELVSELLPVLDGVELALNSGKSLLERRHAQRQIAQETQEQALSQHREMGMVQRTWQRLRRSWNEELIGTEPMPMSGAKNTAYDHPAETSIADAEQMEESLDAWLKGLSLVRERFLGILAGEGIEPIPAQDQPFDPKLHVALSSRSQPNVEDGIVVEVVRKGYHQQGRVLRYAEVVVSQRDC